MIYQENIHSAMTHGNKLQTTSKHWAAMHTLITTQPINSSLLVASFFTQTQILSQYCPVTSFQE